MLNSWHNWDYSGFNIAPHCLRPILISRHVTVPSGVVQKCHYQTYLGFFGFKLYFQDNNDSFTSWLRRTTPRSSTTMLRQKKGESREWEEWEYWKTSLNRRNIKQSFWFQLQRCKFYEQGHSQFQGLCAFDNVCMTVEIALHRTNRCKLIFSGNAGTING